MLISILACLLGFHAITFERSTFTKITILKSSQCGTEPVGIAFGRLVPRSGRKHGNRQTNRQTDLQTKYSNPRCACAPRVTIWNVWDTDCHLVHENSKG